MKRAYDKPPPFPLSWECDVCGMKGLTVQRIDDHQAVACLLCEKILCAQCRSRHMLGGQMCLKLAGGRAA